MQSPTTWLASAALVLSASSALGQSVEDRGRDEGPFVQTPKLLDDETRAAEGFAPGAFRLYLNVRVPAEDVRLSWSPKGAKVPLTPMTMPASGPHGVGEVTGWKGEIHFDTPYSSTVVLKPSLQPGGPMALFLRDVEAPGGLLAEPTESRGKLWYSWDHTLMLKNDWVHGQGPERAYPISLWYVFDPNEPDAEPVLRWSRRGWHEAHFKWQGQHAALLICEAEMDGVFHKGDAWHLELLGPLEAETDETESSDDTDDTGDQAATSERDGADTTDDEGTAGDQGGGTAVPSAGTEDTTSTDKTAAQERPWQARATSRPLSRHAWLGEDAFRMVDLDSDGLWIILEPYDPGITRAEEAALDDAYAADRRAARAEAPLAFGHDFEAAEALAKREGRPLFVDFETTWCGPCKQMDALVYTAQAVVDAAASTNVVAVKVDGDERPDLVERFAVGAYPTLVLVQYDEAGKPVEKARRVGYQSVAKLTALLAELTNRE